MTEPVNIRELRALNKDDATLWTPLDCLKAIVRDLESGEMKQVDAIYVAMMRRREDGQAEGFPFYAAGAKTIELRGILAQHLLPTNAARDDYARQSARIGRPRSATLQSHRMPRSRAASFTLHRSSQTATI